MSNPDYSFQGPLVEEAYSKLMGGHRVVLAAAPGAGKTDMSIVIASRYLEERGRKVLVLAHGQTVIRDQYYKRLISKAPPFKFVALGVRAPTSPDVAQVHVALPHYFKSRDASGYGLIVVDEAHQFFHAPMVQKILEQNPEAKLLLLTGSPAYFIGAGWPVVAMSASELLDCGVITDPVVELVQTDLPFTHKDYNAYEDLKTGKAMGEAHVTQALKEAMAKLCGALADRALGKTLVVCNRQDQAEIARGYFAARGLETLLSTCSTDTDSTAVDAFKTGSAQVLVVVNRATLGFDFPELRNVVDISCSMNPERLFQALCRVIRRSKQDPGAVKRFIKVTPTNTAELTHHVMSFVMALAAPTIYRTFARDWKEVRTPKRCPVAQPVSRRRDAPGPNVDLPRFFTFREIREIENGLVTPYAWSSFAEARKMLVGRAAANEEDWKELEEFFRRYRRYPMPKRSPDEDRLATFRCRALCLDRDRLHALYDKCGVATYRSKAEERVKDALDLEAFLARERRLPLCSRPGEARLSAAEGRMKFADRVKARARYGITDPVAKSKTRQWAALEEFYIRNGRSPSPGAPHEKDLRGFEVRRRPYNGVKLRCLQDEYGINPGWTLDEDREIDVAGLVAAARTQYLENGGFELLWGERLITDEEFKQAEHDIRADEDEDEDETDLPMSAQERARFREELDEWAERMRVA